MFSNYFKIAWRQLLKNKVYSVIKIGGLSASLAFSFLVLLFINHEFSFDNFHKDKENIYRVEAEIDIPKAEANGTMVRWFANNNPVNKTARLGGAVANSLVEEIPGVTESVRMLEGDAIVKLGEDVFSEDIDYVDKNFFGFFSFPFKYGNDQVLQSNKNSIVLTEELAEKYFRNVNPIGRTLELIIENNSEVYTVAGVTQKIPDNSSITLDIVMPIENHHSYNKINNDFGSLNVTTFIKLSSTTNFNTVNEQLKLFSRSKFAGLFGNGTFEESADPDELAFQLHLTQLEDIYFVPDIVSRQKKSNPDNAYILGGIALLILFIGSTNYISLSLASSVSRSLEVGVRKVMGADRKEITKQFISEAVIVSIISSLLALLVAEALTPIFNELTGSAIDLSLLSQPMMLIGALLLTIIVGLIAGFYPAIIISKFPSILAIAHGRSTKYRTGFVSVLVGIQFALSSFLITSSVIMSKQMNFVSSKDVGYNPENIVVVSTYHAGDNRGDVYRRLKNRLSGSQYISDITGTNMSFGRGMWMNGLMINGEMTFAHYYFIEPNYIDLLGIKLKEGRNFNPEISSDVDRAIIVNETLAKLYGGDVVGKQIQMDSSEEPITIIGITENYNFESLLNEVKPMYLTLGGNDFNYSYAIVKIKPGSNDEALNEIRSAWTAAAPNVPFEYGYMIDHVNRQYQHVSYWQSVVNASTMFAVFIACLGLFGITGLQAINKTREIGIRKVLGANVRDIVMLVNKKILITAGIAFVISIPFSIEVIRRWLEQFAFRIELSFDLFIIAAVLSLLVGIVTVAFHSARASLINPVETLKTE